LPRLVDEETEMARLGRDPVEAQILQAQQRFTRHTRNSHRHLVARRTEALALGG
jgi:trimethylamine:corrinoid methyltransferase-like protein